MNERCMRCGKRGHWSDTCRANTQIHPELPQTGLKVEPRAIIAQTRDRVEVLARQVRELLARIEALEARATARPHPTGCGCDDCFFKI